MASRPAKSVAPANARAASGRHGVDRRPAGISPLVRHAIGSSGSKLEDGRTGGGDDEHGGQRDRERDAAHAHERAQADNGDGVRCRRGAQATIAEEPQADGCSADEERQRSRLPVRHGRDAIEHGRLPDRAHEVGAGEAEEDAGNHRAVRVAASGRDPGERGGLGGPGDRDGRCPELDRCRHRDRREACPDRQEAEQVGVAVSPDEREADGEVGDRNRHEEQSAVHDQVAIEQREPGPEEEGRICEHEGGGRRAQVVAVTANLLSCCGDEVDEPEEGDGGDADPRVRGPVDPDGDLRSGEQERHRRQPGP